MVDERGATWRVFLALNSFDRVLTLGVDLGTVIGLSRVGKYKVEHVAIDLNENEIDIDIVRNDHGKNVQIHHSTSDLVGKYSLIVIGIIDEQIIIDSDFINTYLENKGSLVILNTTTFKPSKHFFQNLKFTIEEITALPQKTPRLYFPLNTHTIRTKGLEFHKPGRLISRLALKVLSILSSYGCIWPLRRNALVIASKDLIRESESFTYKDWIEKQLGYTLLGLIAYAGSDTERRKITLLAVANNSQSNVVIKVGDTEQGKSAIKQETKALSSLASTRVKSQIPRLLFEKQYEDGSWVQGQSVFKGNCYQVSFLTDAHFKFLKELSTIERTSLPIKNSLLWTKIKQNADSQTTMPTIIENLFQWLQKNVSEGAKAICHRIHGDFAPWNIQTNKVDFFVFDWEDSVPDGLAGIDLFHFIYRQADLVGPWPGVETLFDTILQDLEKLKKIAQIEVNSYEIIGLCILLEFFRKPSDHIIGLAENLVHKVVI